MHARMTGRGTSHCRALVGGFGTPGLRDLDFGRALVEWFQQFDWPSDVVVEDLSCSAPLVLHRLQELRPAKVVLVGAVGRDLDPPGTIRRYRVDLAAPRPAEVHRSVEEAVMGLVDLDHTLAMARHWGALPVDTVVVEVEPAEASFGLGFSDVLAACFDPVLDAVREELGMEGGAGMVLERDAAPAEPDEGQPSEELDGLCDYAAKHAQARLHSHRAPALAERVSTDVPGVELAGHVRPWGVFVESGGDWFDAVPLDDGALGIVVGAVPGRGVEAAAAMSDLRAAVRAYLVRDGDSPAALVGHLDRLADATGLGRQARLLYMTLHPATGEVRYASAGACPPLVLHRGTADGRFAGGSGGPALGAATGAARPETSLRLAPGSTLLLFTDGLVRSRDVSRDAGMERLRRAADGGPRDLDDLCRHVLSVCTSTLQRDDDICLLGVRLVAGAVPAHSQQTVTHGA
ncbi:MAG TPA: SpoIIE family protein phosphatase [Acidimicrobiales bacterium]|nr:SpoIIE family protein phosphatase [Acidimicrobiales bacterium]